MCAHMNSIIIQYKKGNCFQYFEHCSIKVMTVSEIIVALKERCNTVIMCRNWQLGLFLYRHVNFFKFNMKSMLMEYLLKHHLL